MKSEHHVYRVAQGILWQEMDKESVLLNLQTEQYHALDPVGTRIWKLLAESGSIDAVVKAMLQEYRTEEVGLRRDVERLVQDLAARGLLVEQAADETAP